MVVNFIMTSPKIKMSPRPVPQFFNDYNVLATKKQRYSSTPKPKVPPRPPTKSFTQHSRISFTLNSSQINQQAQIVSFRKTGSQPKLCSLYDSTLKEPYLKQCFTIEEKIGNGSFGDVFKVKSLHDHCYYAVKISREKFKGKIDREEKLNEVCKHEQLPSHNHLVRFHCAWEEKQRLFIQTELCTMSLSTLADNNHEIPEQLVWNYLVDLLKALDHLHSYNLIHLDIKPENIFISEDGLCKLGDFGLIFDITNHQRKEATEGDPKYLASEIMQGVFTKSADIFSLGLTILELASDLDLPSRGEGWHMLRSGNIPANIFSNMSHDLKTIIQLMLDPDHQKRPSAQSLLNHPIVRKYEKQRREELRRKNSIITRLTRILIQKHLNWLDFSWLSLNSFFSFLYLPLRNAISKFFHQTEKKNYSNHSSLSVSSCSSSKNSSPINHNRTHISTFLDQYSENEELENETYPISNHLLETSLSNDESENFHFANKLISKNLCSTLARNNNTQAHNLKMTMQSPQLSPLFQEQYRSVIQRLSFDDDDNHQGDDEHDEEDFIGGDVVKKFYHNDFSSDDENEMQFTDDDESFDPLSSDARNRFCQAEKNFRLLKNVSRKNLIDTFDHIDDANT